MVRAGRGSVDVVIVGAGSAGCVLAERLSRNPDRTVLLLERGPGRWPSDADRDLRVLPIGSGAPFAVEHVEASGLGVVRGSGFGGSATVNGGYFLRWHPGDFVGWPAGWTPEDIERGYDELDGPDGTMRVSAFSDAELSESATRFEAFWRHTFPTRPAEDPWPIIGVNRVRSNRVGQARMTAAEAYLRPAVARRNLIVRAEAEVDALVTAGRRVAGVRVGGEVIECGEVIVCAGTLGTAAILLRSGLVASDEVGVREHREMLVHYRSRDDGPRTALLQSVLHTDDDLEIRCYSSDMAKYIDGLAPVGPAIGVAAMRPGAPGSLRLTDAGVLVHLGDVDVGARQVLDDGVAVVTEMLHSADFADLVVGGSVAVDPVVRTSQHAWGSFPMGIRTDGLGVVGDVAGLRIVDGSILPTAGRSGPHATIMMVACRIGDVLASE
ncbi:mycofactocin system GMC family oxidoreductase MftG [Gordonia sp. CPCC 206044]|uniref:mycofactocin system GMC family oxidoreductase MftG n=1 Tax=Gordonia sp. CPCC 206044 TaxID=3140793 RepID=UPI003AF38444